MIGIITTVNDADTIFGQKLITEIQTAVFLAIISGVVIYFPIGSIIVIHGIAGKTAGKIKRFMFS